VILIVHQGGFLDRAFLSRQCGAGSSLAGL
jgi:hypothetical protein